MKEVCTLLNKFKNLISFNHKIKNEHNKRSYDGASSSNTINWKTSTSFSPNSEIMMSHEILRDRARDLVRNNAYAARVITSITANTIGTGIMHQFKNLDQKIWDKWANSTQCDADGINTYYGIQGLVLREVAEAGDCFVRKIYSEYNGKNIPLKLRIVESEYLDITKNGFFNGDNYVSQGIEFDPSGKRVAYYIFPYHPENDLGWRHVSERVSSSEIIHVFRPDRAGQSRGITWLAPVLLEFRNLDNYQNAELKRREVSACFAGFIKNPDLDISLNDKQKKINEFSTFRITPGMVYDLSAGQEITFSSPQGDSSIDAYISSVLRKIAVGMGVTYEILAGNLSQVNFSSGRMGFLEFQRNLDLWRWHMMIPMMCDIVSNWFLETLEISRYSTKKVEINYTAPMREMIDPSTEIDAMKNAIRSGLKSYPEALRELGYNPEKVIEEITEYNKILSSKNIILDCDPSKVSQQGILQMNQENKTTPTKSTQNKGKKKNVSRP